MNDDLLLDCALKLQQAGEVEPAIACYTKLLQHDPNHFIAWVNISLLHMQADDLAKAVDGYQKAIALQPHHPIPYSHMGILLRKQGRHQEALAHYHKALTLDPNQVDFHNNLGNLLRDMQQHKEAIEVYQQSLKINPQQIEVYNTIGTIEVELGRLGAAMQHYLNALIAQPAAETIYSAMGLTLESLCQHMQSSEDHLHTWLENWLSQMPDNPVEHAILRFKVKQILGLALEQPHQQIIEALPTTRLKSPVDPSKQPTQPPRHASTHRRKDMVGLINLARSGSGYIHSLLDHHPQISTTPGVYMSGYFGRHVWQQLTAHGFGQIAEQFATLYEVLFDARSTVKPPPPFIGDVLGSRVGVGVAEGFDRMGPQRNEALKLNRDAFVAELQRRIHAQAYVDQGSVFELAHDAYETVLARNPQQMKVIFNHIHQIDPFSLSNLLKHRPDLRMLVIIRNPVQSCESWCIKADSDRLAPTPYALYMHIVSKLNRTLVDINHPLFARRDAVAIRLEDLKVALPSTMEDVSHWMGIEFAETMLQSTMQGLEWWGDPSSVLYGKKQTANHGSQDPTKDKAGRLFSDQDRYILNVLFYPLRARFGYTTEDPQRFKRDLEQIKPMLDQPFDFEKQLAMTFPQHIPALEQTGAYRSFHNMLRGRWNLLQHHGTYPNMYSPISR
ncbi:Tetratricopeptide TPR_2 repeat protein [Magnetococcus marinus MC-1]|uniref:Tetratricopeptide TPR_2 repeat protein n=1 Tax=Magnetococcus marinus (strain ATCC BAA-1437 / JCM 17883 / MC-1) TaxID=156889 RepID=A0LAQ7_MAGMM|nr:tetratricopeptide repeat protein [Magnetococcus marinus]ABK45050.1 Tetratricopeptide TPR_2 repeat protein [Magnetococcus marinus MC-1]